MNIGVICFPSYGGSGIVATEIGLLSAKKGHNVHFISYRQPARLNHFYSNVFFHEVPLISYPLFDHIPYESAFISNIVDVAVNQKLDILHVHYAIPNAHIAISAKEILKTKNIDIPVILTLHGTDITLVGNDKTYSSIIEYSINSSDAVTAVSKYLKTETLKTFTVTQDIKVIYNFIDIDKYQKPVSDVMKKRIAPNGEKILMHVSNFRKVKRVEDVVKVFMEVRKQIPIKMLMVGDGPERQNIEMMCRENRVCQDISILGKVDNLEEVLPNADIFLLPSEQESFGLASLEAMAASVPVISSNAGGIPEVVVNGHSGFLSDVGDVASMTKYTMMLLKDDTMMQSFKKNALARAKHFSYETIYPQYEEIYLFLQGQ